MWSLNLILNLFNISLQGQDAVVCQLYAHIKAFGTKLQLFRKHLLQMERFTAHFPALQVDRTTSLRKRRGTQQPSHLFLKSFFAAIEKDMLLSSSPFSVDPDHAPPQLQLELIELQCDNEWRGHTSSFLLLTFTGSWIKAGFQKCKHLQRKC